MNIKSKKIGLVLGGGGSRGAYEIGVWQALRELGISVDMVFGTSIGAINGAMIVQDTFNEIIDLWKELDTATAFELESDTDLENALELIQKKGADLDGLKKILGKFLNEDTIRTSHINYGLVTVEIPSLKPCYLTKSDIPPGRMMDFICASASCFPAIHAYEIDGKKYIDGGYADNIPVGMAIENGATDIISVNLRSFGLNPKQELGKNVNVTEISSKWDLGNFMLFKRDNISKIMRLGFLETYKALGYYYGDYFTFDTESFNKKEVIFADKAAKIFELEPEIIYEKTAFNKLLKNAAYQHNLQSKPIYITLALARELISGKKIYNFFNSPAITALIRDELHAALYLVKEDLY